MSAGNWLEEESRAVAQHESILGVRLTAEEKLIFRSGWRAAIRAERARPIDDTQISAAEDAYLVEQIGGGFVPNMCAALEAARKTRTE